jgi:hypothetical protein
VLIHYAAAAVLSSSANTVAGKWAKWPLLELFSLALSRRAGIIVYFYSCALLWLLLLWMLRPRPVKLKYSSRADGCINLIGRKNPTARRKWKYTPKTEKRRIVCEISFCSVCMQRAAWKIGGLKELGMFRARGRIFFKFYYMHF